MEEDCRSTTLGNVIRIDGDRVSRALGPDRAGHGRGDAEGDAGSGGGSAVQCRAVRAHSSTTGSAVRQLRSQAADHGRRAESEGAEAAAADLRDGDHRALSAAGEVGGEALIEMPQTMPVCSNTVILFMEWFPSQAKE
jgi:hypothetical protein